VSVHRYSLLRSIRRRLLFLKAGHERREAFRGARRAMRPATASNRKHESSSLPIIETSRYGNGDRTPLALRKNPVSCAIVETQRVREPSERRTERDVRAFVRFDAVWLVPAQLIARSGPQQARMRSVRHLKE
jgi:hypothetical protein